MTSKAGYWLGGGLMVLAAVGAILWLVYSAREGVTTIDEFQRVPVPGGGTVRLEDRKYVVYIEGPGVQESRPDVSFAILDPRTEQRLRVESYSGSLTYSLKRSGTAVATVTPPRAGEYELRTQALGDAGRYDIALGDSITGRILRTIFGALAIGFALGLSGVALIVATSVRRRRRKSGPPADGSPEATLPGIDSAR